MGSGAIDIKAPPEIEKIASLRPLDDMTEIAVASQFGKIICIGTKSDRAAGRAIVGVKPLDLDTDVR